jgi:actin-related protein 10
MCFSRALKTGGTEVAREKWDEADAQMDGDDGGDVSPQTPHSARSILPDWTRSPLPVGAPPAKAPIPAIQPVVNVVVASPRAAA